MKFKNIRRWKQDTSLNGLLFFAQRMDETLWDFTLDTHKPPTLNAPFLCKEAIELTSYIENELIDQSNLGPVLEELNWSVQNDPIAKSLLDLPIERYTQETSKISDIKLKLEVLGCSLAKHRYLDTCCDFLHEAVAKSHKKNIDLATRNLVTTLINMGVSKRHLREKNYNFFFSPSGPEIDSSEKIVDFLKSIYPFNHEFKIYVIVSNVIKEVEDSLKAFNIELAETIPEELTAFANEKDFQKTNNQTYAIVSKISALDPFSAQEKAFNRLDQLSDLFTLFHHREKISWDNPVLVTQCCTSLPSIVLGQAGAMKKPLDMRADKASKELNRFIRNFAFTKSSLERFKRVADLHGICVSTDIVENQLVNLWTAFETLTPSKANRSKIANLVDSIVPFLLISYFDDLIRDACHDLVIWRPWTLKKILSKVESGERSNLKQKLHLLLCTKENAEIREELYRELGDFHLLRFRIFQLSETLSSPQKIKKSLSSHEQKLRWQIRRIYRTRNLIVHSGDKPPYINSLVENGHNYLDKVVFNIMKISCGEHRASTLEQSFELAKIKYESFLRTLEEVREFDGKNHQFLCETSINIHDFLSTPWNPKMHTTT